MFEQAFKNIDDVLWKEAGCTTELDYTEQTSWLLFLKYLDGLEQDRATEAALDRKSYTYILDKPYRWESWAAPKGKDGKLDHNKAMTGDDLRDFVNQKLFPYLHGFTLKATREVRAANAKVFINTKFDAKQQAFLDFVLEHYVTVGVEELDQSKLTPLFRLKYHNSMADAVADLGRPAEIG